MALNVLRVGLGGRPRLGKEGPPQLTSAAPDPARSSLAPRRRSTVFPSLARLEELSLMECDLQGAPRCAVLCSLCMLR